MQCFMNHVEIPQPQTHPCLRQRFFIHNINIGNPKLLLSFCFLPPVSSSLESCTITSDPHSSTVSYLVNNCGFSQDSALKASRRLRLHNPQKSDSVLSFFRNHGFPDSQIHSIVKREVQILLLDPDKVLFPKIEFLRSKGVSTSDIVRAVSTNPRFLTRSLENHIIPSYELVKGFLQSDQQVVACIKRSCRFLCDGNLALNVKLLLDCGVKREDISKLFRMWPAIFYSAQLLDTVEELKQLGFQPSTLTFCIALLAKKSVNKTKWDEKVETFKRWGWSQEHVLQAFKRQPYCMLASTDKINAVMNFWVNQLDWNALDLVKAPGLFLFSLHKRIIPRALVLQFLVSKGLRKKGAGITTPFSMPEKSFLEKFVKRFPEDSSHLLKMYEENMNIANNRENNTCL
ncbi:hypothetical protein VNO77_05746 [Canavalia gladiata]|uniref:Uncharacterized protein n=1 Tax=Canavalia gladiata TaxID=3824 RepID=A0AAN9N431_CANGL